MCEFTRVYIDIVPFTAKRASEFLPDNTLSNSADFTNQVATVDCLHDLSLR